MTRTELRDREASALGAVFPRLEEHLAQMDVAPCVVAPVVSDEKCKQFVGTLYMFGEMRSRWDAESAGAPLDGKISSAPLIMVPHRSILPML